jgi:hypothetical protein
MIECTKKYQQHTGDGKDDKKRIIFFEKTGLHLVMIFMQVPKKTMHYILMGKPGHSFHGNKSA